MFYARGNRIRKKCKKKKKKKIFTSFKIYIKTKYFFLKFFFCLF
jgi:hypothetical protein